MADLRQKVRQTFVPDRSADPLGELIAGGARHLKASEFAPGVFQDELWVGMGIPQRSLESGQPVDPVMAYDVEIKALKHAGARYPRSLIEDAPTYGIDPNDMRLALAAVAADNQLAVSDVMLTALTRVIQRMDQVSVTLDRERSVLAVLAGGAVFEPFAGVDLAALQGQLRDGAELHRTMGEGLIAYRMEQLALSLDNPSIAKQANDSGVLREYAAATVLDIGFTSRLGQGAPLALKEKGDEKATGSVSVIAASLYRGLSDMFQTLQTDDEHEALEAFGGHAEGRLPLGSNLVFVRPRVLRQVAADTRTIAPDHSRSLTGLSETIENGINLARRDNGLPPIHQHGPTWNRELIGGNLPPPTGRIHWGDLETLRVQLSNSFEKFAWSAAYASTGKEWGQWRLLSAARNLPPGIGRSIVQGWREKTAVPEQALAGVFIGLPSGLGKLALALGSLIPGRARSLDMIERKRLAAQGVKEVFDMPRVLYGLRPLKPWGSMFNEPSLNAPGGPRAGLIFDLGRLLDPDYQVPDDPNHPRTMLRQLGRDIATRPEVYNTAVEGAVMMGESAPIMAGHLSGSKLASRAAYGQMAMMSPDAHAFNIPFMAGGGLMRKIGPSRGLAGAVTRNLATGTTLGPPLMIPFVHGLRQHQVVADSPSQAPGALPGGTSYPALPEVPEIGPPSPPWWRPMQEP